MEFIQLDIIPTGYNPLVYVSQNDNDRAVRASLTENKTPYILTGSEALTLHVETPDKNIIEYPLTNAGGSSIDFSIDPEITAKAGKCYSKIIVDNGSQKLGFSGFYIVVEKAP